MRVIGFLILLWTQAAAKCSSMTTCTDCLAASPAFSFGLAGEHCIFCPTASLGEIFPGGHEARALTSTTAIVGTCWDEGSSDVLVVTYGSCNVHPPVNVRDGWIAPKKKTTPAEVCGAYVAPENPAILQPAVSSDSVRPDEIGRSEVNQIFALMNSFRYLNLLSDYITRMLYLRAVDQGYFESTVSGSTHHIATAFSTEGGKAVLGEVIGLIPVVGGGLSATTTIAFWAVEKIADTFHDSLFDKGGRGMLPLFSDASYDNLWTAYTTALSTITAVKANVTETPEAVGALNAAVLGALRQTAERDVLAGRTASQIWNDVDMGLNHQATRWTLHGVNLALQGGGLIADATGVGVVVGVPLHIAGLVISGVDLISRLVTKSASVKNIELRLGHMAMSLFAYEAAIRGTLVGVKSDKFINGAPMLDGAALPTEGVPCRITSGRKNHGCAKELFCKREFVFYPENATTFARTLLSPNGFCAPLTKIQRPYNGRCLLHSDCATGLCGFNTHVVSNAVSSTGAALNLSLSASNGFTRGDQDVKAGSTIAKELSLRQRLLALTGVCVWPRDKGSLTEPPRDCYVITPEHKFFACKTRPALREVDKEEPVNMFLKSYTELKAVKKAVDDSVIDTRVTPKSPTLKRASTMPYPKSKKFRQLRNLKDTLEQDIRRLDSVMKALEQ